jgi:hypothetical protein
MIRSGRVCRGAIPNSVAIAASNGLGEPSSKDAALAQPRLAALLRRLMEGCVQKVV